MSFFDDDEDDAIEQEPRRAARSGAPQRPRGGASGGGGSGGPRPPRSTSPRRGTDPAVERRRWVALAVIVVVVILMILLISSCQARNTKNSLEDYNNSVSELITRSDGTGATVFKQLSSGGGSGSAIASSLATPLRSARTELKDAEDLGVPGQMASAQRDVVLALQMRVDGISEIANNVSSATSSSGSEASAAVAKIAAGTARFYASDVIYILYAARDITEALHGDGIAVGGTEGVSINHGQFLTNLGWLQESYIETTLGASVTTGGSTTSGTDASLDDAAKCQTSTCVHGSYIDSAAVGSNVMSTSATNTVAGSPAPTFSVTFTNGGGYDEYGIGCKVSVEGGPSGTGTVSGVTAPGATATCTVKLSGPVTAGVYTVTATVDPVPGETNLSDNSEQFSVQFQ